MRCPCRFLSSNYLNLPACHPCSTRRAFPFICWIYTTPKVGRSGLLEFKISFRLSCDAIQASSRPPLPPHPRSARSFIRWRFIVAARWIILEGCHRRTSVRWWITITSRCQVGYAVRLLIALQTNNATTTPRPGSSGGGNISQGVV